METTCPDCKDVIERQDIPHTVRKCPGCGREMHIVERGEHGRGVTIKDGDRFVIPGNWLQFSLNPLKSRGTFTRYGLQWFAKKIWMEDLPSQKDSVDDELKKIEDYSDKILKSSKLLEGLDVESPADSERIVEVLKANQESPEWWAFLAGVFLSFVRQAQDRTDVNQAIWGAICAERARAMRIYKEHLEEVVWMGHSAKRIVDALRTWDTNKDNSDEEFWQIAFKEHSYVISQVFAVPMVFIKDKAYVGGMNLEQKDAKFVDYLFSLESSREAILVEIKAPTTPVIGTKYRGIFKPSAELSGAVIQALDYRAALTQSLQTIVKGTGHDIELFHPRCVVIIGNGDKLKSQKQRKSFELFRGNLKDVEIVTYDELFRKVEILANLFNLIRNRKSNRESNKAI
jgi:hypothetical protein